DKLETIITEQEKKSNDYEVDLEEKCVYIIAQYQPKAFDLRLILCVLKMSNDLERIADHIVNIAQSGSYLIDHDFNLLNKYRADIEQIWSITNNMLTESITSFIEQNSAAAKNLCKLDQSVDHLKAQIYRKIIEDIKIDPLNIERYLHLERIINNIERIADLSTNICEDIVFLYEAKIIKHHRDESL
ncbi:MAG: phosphate signaling complex protein PhoU, partial [Endomicrobia bacterium]|nr:phosphate signaling complex protein PhoU [Endomicrobiia bacterium]